MPITIFTITTATYWGSREENINLSTSNIKMLQHDETAVHRAPLTSLSFFE